MNIKPGGARLGVDYRQTFREQLAGGLLGSTGIAYGAVATIQAAASVNTLVDKFIDPGHAMKNESAFFHLISQFIGVNGSNAGTMAYYWQARSEWFDGQGGKSAGIGTMRVTSYVPLTGTYNLNVGTLLTSTPTLTGYAPIASLPYTPIRLQLKGYCLTANRNTHAMAAQSYVELIGNVIPGA